MLDLKLSDLDLLTDEEFEVLEQRTARLLSAWQVQNLRGCAAVFWDDQRIGEKRHELKALKHPSVDVQAEMAFRGKPVVDSLEGNTLVHPLTTPVIVVDPSNTKARSVFWSLGVEGLSKFREKPEAIVSIGMVPGANIVEDGEWKMLWGAWQRTTKNEVHAGWVESMIPTNTRPPLTPEQDRAMLGKYAYQKDEIRKPVPEPPHDDTWARFPDEADQSYLYVNLEPRKTENQEGLE